MNEELYRDLIAGGMDSTDARSIASKHTQVEQGAIINVDELFKSIEEIKGLQPGFDAIEDTDCTPDLTQEAMIKAIDTAEGQIDRVQAGVDLIVDHVLSAMDDRKSAQVVLAERQDVLAEGLSDVTEALSKSIDQQNSILALMSELSGRPMARKSVTGAAQVISSPGEEMVKGGAFSAQGLLQKALTEMETLSNAPQTMHSTNRISQLHHAVSAIESGASPDLVAQKYRIKANA